LDEIGDMPFSTQTRLLRVLANGEFYRVGGQQPVKVDVRIIAATHQNLEDLVKQGKFREDLFYRLNVIRMPLPPLRTRREDIPALTVHFMQRAAEQMDTPAKQLNTGAMRVMQSFYWRGNVRQLENVCLWLTVMATGDTVTSEDLPPELMENIIAGSSGAHISNPNYDQETSSEYGGENITGSDAVSGTDNTMLVRHQTPKWQYALAQWAEQSLLAGETDILQTATPEFERILLKAALNHSDGKKIAAASLLGWGRNTLTRKLQLLETPAAETSAQD
jgi:two-component system nitrogen regulation response regulator GlnG